MNPQIDRRAFLKNTVASALGGTSLSAALAAESLAPGGTPSTPSDTREVRLERLRPREIEEAMKNCPVLFQPLGTIEWHGRHNIAGLDAVKAHHLCVRAAQRGGGLVAQALFGGVGGMEEPPIHLSWNRRMTFIPCWFGVGWRGYAVKRCGKVLMP